MISSQTARKRRRAEHDSSAARWWPRVVRENRRSRWRPLAHLTSEDRLVTQFLVMRRSWLYFATRSVRQSEPVLIWPALVATAMSAIVVSSVSPER